MITYLLVLVALVLIAAWWARRQLHRERVRQEARRVVDLLAGSVLVPSFQAGRFGFDVHPSDVVPPDMIVVADPSVFVPPRGLFVDRPFTVEADRADRWWRGVYHLPESYPLITRPDRAVIITGVS